MTGELLAEQYRFTHYVIKANIDGLTHAESLIAPQPAGNCANWVLGHILSSRNLILTSLASMPLLDDVETQRYRRGEQPFIDGDPAALPLERLVAVLDASQETIMRALPALSEAELGRSVMGPFGRKDRLGSVLAGLAFHEAYHSGQLGLLRRLIGKPGAIR